MSVVEKNLESLANLKPICFNLTGCEGADSLTVTANRYHRHLAC